MCCHPSPFTGEWQLERKTTRFYISYRSYILRKTIYPSKQSCTTAAVNEFVTLRMKFLRMLLPASPIFISSKFLFLLNIHVYGILESASIFLFACISMITRTPYFDKYSFPLYCCWILRITHHVTMSIKKKNTVEKKNKKVFEVWPP